MQIKLASVLVDDQEKALKFYTGQLGFLEPVLPLSVAAQVPFRDGMQGAVRS